MALFASKTPRDLNHDPLPYVNDREGVWNRYPDEETANYFSGGVYRFNPSPEFDHVQHNEPNPILVAFRAIDAGRNEFASWVRDFDTNPGFWTRGHDEPNARYRQYTPAQVDHARRVLTRLARMESQR